MVQVGGWFYFQSVKLFFLLHGRWMLYVCYCKETIWIWRLQGDCNARTVCAVVVLDVVYRCAILISLDTGH